MSFLVWGPHNSGLSVCLALAQERRINSRSWLSLSMLNSVERSQVETPFRLEIIILKMPNFWERAREGFLCCFCLTNVEFPVGLEFQIYSIRDKEYIVEGVGARI